MQACVVADQLLLGPAQGCVLGLFTFGVVQGLQLVEGLQELVGPRVGCIPFAVVSATAACRSGSRCFDDLDG